MSFFLAFVFAVWILNCLKCEILVASRILPNDIDESSVHDNQIPTIIPEVQQMTSSGKGNGLEYAMYPYNLGGGDNEKSFHLRRSSQKNARSSGLVAQRRSALDDNFMRFGRAAQHKRQAEKVNQQMAMDEPDVSEERYGRSDGGVSRDSRGDNFMRFGRSRNMMRFGRSGSGSMMRFGRSNNNNSNMMRFGRSDELFYPQSREIRNPNMIRFGRSSPNNFLRFGKSADFEVTPAHSGALRQIYATLPLDLAYDIELESDEALGEPHFEKKADSLMRFGRNDDNFMRFGKKSDDKSFMRFGKRNPVDAADNIEWNKLKTANLFNLLDDYDAASSSSLGDLSAPSPLIDQHHHRINKDDDVELSIIAGHLPTK